MSETASLIISALAVCLWLTIGGAIGWKLRDRKAREEIVRERHFAFEQGELSGYRDGYNAARNVARGPNGKFVKRDA